MGVNAPPGEIISGTRIRKASFGFTSTAKGADTVSAEDSLTIVCEPEHFAEAAAGAHGERRRGDFGFVRFCHGGM